MVINRSTVIIWKCLKIKAKMLIAGWIRPIPAENRSAVRLKSICRCSSVGRATPWLDINSCPLSEKSGGESRITVKDPCRVKTVATLSPERLTRVAKSRKGICQRYSLILSYKAKGKQRRGANEGVGRQFNSDQRLRNPTFRLGINKGVGVAKRCPR